MPYAKPCSLANCATSTLYLVTDRCCKTPLKKSMPMAIENIVIYVRVIGIANAEVGLLNVTVFGQDKQLIKASFL